MRLALLATTIFVAAVPAFAGPISSARHDATRAMFERLIDTPTVIGRGKVPEMAGYLADQFKAAGFPAADVSVVPYHSASKDGAIADDTAALIVRWRAAGKPAKKPLLLMGHMDVVEAKREDSTTDPFKLTERDGYYYGRGSIDMKAGLTGIAQALIDLKTSGFKPTRDIVVFFTGDEETNGVGARKGATEWLAQLGNPEIGPQRRRRRDRLHRNRQAARRDAADRGKDLCRLSASPSPTAAAIRPSRAPTTRSISSPTRSNGSRRTASRRS